MHQPVNTQKLMHYLNYALSDTVCINVAKLTKNQLKMKDVIQCHPALSLPAHLLEMGQYWHEAFMSSSAPSVHTIILFSSIIWHIL